MKIQKQNQRTVFIYNETTIQFFVVDGDYSHLNNVYINYIGSEDFQNQLIKILFTENEFDHTYKVHFLDDFPVEEVINGAKIIKCGYYF
jgi:hypothetical protein